MSIFSPDIRNIADFDVPVRCPTCDTDSTRDGLSDTEKQYLIDATMYHEFYVEYRFLLAMKAIVDRYPGTQHPLLRDKLEKPGRGFTDDVKVSKLLMAQPELCAFLRKCNFSLDKRFSFIQEVTTRYRRKLLSFLVACNDCPDQYLILPDDYFGAIG